jgi:hypothetical protein
MWTGFNWLSTVSSVGHCEHCSVSGVEFFDQLSNYSLLQEGLSSMELSHYNSLNQYE